MKQYDGCAMSEACSPEIDAFNAVVTGVEKYLFIVRDADLQREAIDQLNELTGRLVAWKAQAIKRGDEDMANKFLGCECVTRYLRDEITMWLDLKEGREEKAWESLIAAQRSIGDAIRAHRGFAHLEQNAKRMAAIESVIFPPQVFLSAGLIVGRQECTICGQEYEDCPHVKGRPYWGRLCAVRLSDIRADHVAIVKEPANRLCRVVHFSDGTGKRNRMTWKVDPIPIGSGHIVSDDGREGLLVDGILATTHDTDLSDHAEYVEQLPGRPFTA
ncbi:hypothetical protein [Caulobacter sp. S45]|uniref:hypothetical protein n=1 Tax=Caulobacter sp. S45 TaxID=1641861 RepID=UPI001C204D98|nr:hypothetical protein [Caulobacter sp. S45]